MVSEDFNGFLWPIVDKAIMIAKQEVDPSFSKKVALKSLTEFYMKDKAHTEFVDNAKEAATKYRKNLYAIYQEKREWLKTIYFGFSHTVEAKRLDMHKIASIMCRCIIGCKPFYFDVNLANDYKNEYDYNDNLKWIIDNYFINYKVAFNVAIAITFYDLIEKLSDKDVKKHPKIPVERIIKYFSENNFDLYDRKPELIQSKHESFYKSIILDLAMNDLQKRDFDYLGFAASCFQLQQYEMLNYLLLTDSV